MTGPTASLADRDVIRCVGTDTVTFLQGQLSQDIAAIAVGSSAWSLLLQPQGKVVAWVRVHRVDESELLVEVDHGFGDAVLARLARFRLRVDCEMELLEGWRCLEVRGEGATDVVALAGDTIVAPSIWPGAPGVDLVGRGLSEPDDVPIGVSIDPAAVEVARVRSGTPRMGAELDDTVIPAEAGPWLVDLSASFTKGCYVGQELVARIESRGSNTPRHLRGLTLHGQAEVGEELVDDAGKVVGRITSVASGWALAYVARAVEMPASLRTESGTDVIVEELPI